MASDWMDDIMQMIKILAEKENLQVVAQNAFWGTVIGGAAAAAGLFFGRPGILAGAAVGGLALAFMSGGIKPLTEVLNDLPDEMKMRLCNGIKELLKMLIWPSRYDLLKMVLEDPKLMSTIIDYLKTFFEPLHIKFLPIRA